MHPKTINIKLKRSMISKNSAEKLRVTEEQFDTESNEELIARNRSPYHPTKGKEKTQRQFC